MQVCETDVTDRWSSQIVCLFIDIESLEPYSQTKLLISIISQIIPVHIATFYVKVILINPAMCLEVYTSFLTLYIST
jgi:hypothetical protein